MKDDIVTKSFKEPLEFEGKTIRIMKELPKKVLDSRKDFRPLSDKLKSLKLKFRWESPTGLSFVLKGKS